MNQKLYLTNEPIVQKLLFESKNIKATVDNVEVIKECDIIFTFVPTPPMMDNTYNTENVFKVTNEFFNASSLDIPIYEKNFVICSTTNPGDVDQIQKKLAMFNIRVAYNPNLVIEGEIIKSFENADILLIGTEYEEISKNIVSIYHKFQKTPINSYVMSIKACEVSKISIMTFLSLKINYANMIGEFMINLGLENEIDLVLNSIGGDSRIGKKYMKYGFGFGGKYLPKALRAIGSYFKTLGMNVLSSPEDFNTQHSLFLKNFFIKKNPDKSVPFVMNHITNKKGNGMLEESQQFQLCIDLLNSGYILNVIETPEISKSLNSLSESYGGRLKFYKEGTNPEGFKIKL